MKINLYVNICILFNICKHFQDQSLFSCFNEVTFCILSYLMRLELLETFKNEKFINIENMIEVLLLFWDSIKDRNNLKMVILCSVAH